MAEIKKNSIRDVVKAINKNCKDWDILGSGDLSRNIKKLSLHTLGFDLALRGGLPYGQIAEIAGVEYSGKSTLATIAMAQYQRENPDKVCVYVDAENTLLTQSDYFQLITGISYAPEHFLRYDCTGRSAEEVFQDLIELQGTDEIGMIVIDSARALISQADLDNDFVKDNGQRASIAKSLGKFMKQMMMYLPKKNNMLIVLNQVTVIKDMFMTTYIEPCGYALKYYPSVKFRLATRTFTCKSKDDISQNKADNTVDGLQIHFAITKSRLGGISKEGGFVTIRYNTGVDSAFDFYKVAVAGNFIKNNTLADLETGEILKDKETGKELIFTGEKALQNYLNSHLDVVEEMSKMIIRYVSKTKSSVSLLDDEFLKEILAQEEAVCPTEMTPAEALAKDGVGDDTTRE